MNPTSLVSPPKPIGPESRLARHEPWVWLVVGIPALTVVAGLITWWIAAQRADSDVADHHYKRGLAINRQLEREQLAQQSGLGARLELTPSGLLVVRVHSADGALLPETLLLHLTHPVQARDDQRIALIISPDGAYRGQVSEMVKHFPGQWGLSIEGPGWRIPGARLPLKSGQTIELGVPQRP
jgi:hypothetical protein